MASFVPNHRKKLKHLAKKELELLRLIERGAGQEKLLQVALEVRDGRIRVLRAKQNKTHSEEIAIFEKDKAAIQSLETLTAEAVLAEYLPAR